MTDTTSRLLQPSKIKKNKRIDCQTNVFIVKRGRNALAQENGASESEEEGFEEENCIEKKQGTRQSQPIESQPSMINQKRNKEPTPPTTSTNTKITELSHSFHPKKINK